MVDRQGQVVARTERGEPFVYRKAAGLVPIDPNDPILDDGSVVSQTTMGYTDERGLWHRVVYYQRHPGPAPGVHRQSQESLQPLTPERQRQILTRLLQEQRDPVPVAVLLRESTPAHVLPSRTQTGLAFTEFNRADALTPRMRQLKAENHRRRVIEAGPFKAWIRSIGGRVSYHATLYGNLLSARIPKRQLKALLARPEVVQVEPRVMDTQGESSATTSYLCSNRPFRVHVRDEKTSCLPEYDATGTLVSPAAYLDAVNAATGTTAYIDAGYDGLVAGGLANWGHHPLFTNKQHPTLTYGIRDGSPLDVNHPAFLWYNRSRFAYYLDIDPDRADSGRDEADISIDDVVTTYGEKLSEIGPFTDYIDEAGELHELGHATRCAAVAMANSTLRGDPALSTEEAREARSGVARLVSGLAAVRQVQTYEMFDAINSGYKLGYDEDGLPFEGIDVISSSQKESHGGIIPGGAEDGTDLRCPSEEDARGLDFSSMHIVYAFKTDQVVFTKAGGNSHGLMSGCTGELGVPYEISPPGASPAAIPSSAQNTTQMTAAQIQDAPRLRSDSCRATTPDGRSYPLLASPAQTCGCAGTALDWRDDERSYEHHGQTSATSPRVAGTALIFKHWYLEQFGSVANTAGNIIVNVLNFADGFAFDGGRWKPPYEGWGLGRLGLRLYTDATDSSGPVWGTTSRVVLTGSIYAIDITGGTGTLPSGIRHLRITAWWLEVNTGADEKKASITLVLRYFDRSGAVVIDPKTSGTEHVLRMQYDRDDDTFECPPSGPVTLYLYAPSVPDEVRSATSAGGPTFNRRIVHLAWFWETGEDPTRIDCDSVSVPKEDRCASVAGSGDDTASFTAMSDELRAMSAAADDAVRGALRIATGLGGAGTSPVFEAGLYDRTRSDP